MALSESTLAPLLHFLEQLGARERVHTGRTFLSHCLAVGNLLASWDCTDDVCVAGICHSLYGTEVSRAAPLGLDRRSELRAIIGEQAEQIAYLNCAMDRRSLDLAILSRRPSYRLRDRLTRSVCETTPAVFDDLLRVHLADWIEQVPHSTIGAYRRDTYAAIAQWLGGRPLESYNRL